MASYFFVILLAILGSLPTTLSADAAQWRAQSIYQVLTDRFGRTDNSTISLCDTSANAYCGGSWRGLINHLNYIQDMGFTAVWISPVTKQIEGSANGGTAFHGYWQTDLYDINEHFGTMADLSDLADALHARRMMLMVDVVANHFAFRGASQDVDYSIYNPFNSLEDFHSYCDITSEVGEGENVTNVQDCWLYSNTDPNGGIVLTDVKTDDPDVAEQYYEWISSLVTNYSIDGLRIDTVPYVSNDFWSNFTARSGVFATGEVFNGDTNFACPFQQYLPSILNYPIFFPLRRAFSPGATEQNITDLANMIDQVKSLCSDATVLGSFLDNHDNPRFAHDVSDLVLIKNALTFSILADGIPIVYQGTEQDFTGGANPADREALWLASYNTTAPLYNLVAQLNQIRNVAIARAASETEYLTYNNYPIYTDDSTIAMRKGQSNPVITVLSNLGSEGNTYSFNLNATGYPAGGEVLEVLGCQDVAVGGDGTLSVDMGEGLPKVFYPSDALAGSGVCGR